MFYYKKAQGTGNCLKKYFHHILLGILTLCFALACQKDTVPDPEKEPDPDQQEDPKEDPTTMDDPDTLSEYLVMTGASKISGPLPTAIDEQLKINIQDTTYTVKGYPIAASRFIIKKPVGIEVPSFNVQVNNATNYYRVPSQKPQDNIPMQADSLVVLVLDVQPPDEVSTPVTLDIIIQPLDVDGKPIDEFKRVIVAEDPTNSTCSPLAPNPCPGQHPADCNGLPNWAWDFTHQKYDGYTYYPEIRRMSGVWTTTGCCTNTGLSYFEFEESRCRPGVGGGWEYKELEVPSTSQDRREWPLALYNDGEFYTHFAIGLVNIDETTTDFCSETVGYVGTIAEGYPGGTHDYVPGNTYINLSYDSNFNSGGIVPTYGGILIYTCKTLIIMEEDPEGGDNLQVWHVFRKFGEKSIFDYPEGSRHYYE